MELSQMSNYEKYLVMCNRSKHITPTYSAYMDFKELYAIIRRLATSGSEQYMFANKLYRSPISNSQATVILSDFDNANFNTTSLSIVSELNLRIA